MGIYMESHAMIGVKFTPEQKKITTSIRGCDHPETEAKFCSECGKRMLITEVDWETKFEDIHEDFVEPLYQILKEYFSASATVIALDFDWNNIYIGYGPSVDSDHDVGRVDLPDSDYIRKILEQELTKYDIWESCKDTFGFWVISTGH